MQARVAAVQQRVAGAPRPRVAAVNPQDDGTFRVAGGPDFVTRILAVAGADNAFADLQDRRNFTVGAEEIAARDPDEFLTSTSCNASFTPANPERSDER